ncbi:MAG: threonine/serine dehydratase [Synergistaceae bacterium]|nr:threonine/serine dehydratase [Synergistaceae bacterium]
MEKLPIDPSITDVVKAYKFLKNRVRRTPTEYSRPLSAKAGAPVYLKLENLQLCGSFKLRGALYKMNSLTAEERAAGVVTCSSGNHGQGVAMAAKELRINTKIFVPALCPETKKAAIRWLGGDFVQLAVTEGDYDFTEKAAHEYAEAKGVTYVSSFEDATVVAGQGTAGFEMFTDEPDIELLLIPAGGGGLMNGVSIAAKALNPNVEIWGVQTDTSNPWVVSWADGKVKEVEYGETLADGLAGGIPQSLLTLAKRRVTGILEVTEKELAAAIAFMHREQRQIIEGAGAVGIAALLAGKAPIKGRKTGIVVSGGNIDGDKLLKVLDENR